MRNKTIEKDIVYIAELDGDIDDIVAAHYLHNENRLQCVVCDPYPQTEEGLKRKAELEHLGITVLKKMPPVAKYVFVGGRLTLVADYVKTHHIDLLVMNGGFVGSNLTEYGLSKFKNKEAVRTFNFNCDVEATDYVMRTGEDRIGKIMLVGKNVCHSDRNTRGFHGIWNSNKYKELLDTYHVREDKKLHDLLACHEGLALLDHPSTFYLCNFAWVKPFNKGLKGTYTEWGSTKTDSTPYRKVYAAICFDHCPDRCETLSKLK